MNEELISSKELAELRRDRDRLNWLDRRGQVSRITSNVPAYPMRWTAALRSGGCPNSAATLRKAIDAAMEEKDDE